MLKLSGPLVSQTPGRVRLLTQVRATMAPQAQEIVQMFNLRATEYLYLVVKELRTLSIEFVVI